MLRLAIAGCHGKMGKALVQCAAQQRDVVVTAATVSPGSAWLHKDIGMIAGGAPLQIKAVADLTTVIDQFDVLIDFTTPAASLEHAVICQKYQKNIVIGTTGFSSEQSDQLQAISQSIAMVVAPNMSMGIQVVLRLLQQATQALGTNFDIDILEAHHRHKVDAPSGTALKMGEVIAEALNCQLEEVAYYNDFEKKARDPGKIAFSSLRAGDIVGEHVVSFAGEGERIELVHRAANRSPFAVGAIHAARWVSEKGRGCYTMEEVLFGCKK